MKKIVKGVVCASLCTAMIVASGCSGCSSGLDSETRTLQLSTAALDGNFNPFFYTAQPDGNMVAMTQLPMMTNNENGDLVYGEEQACVVLDRKTTMYDSKEGGSVVPNGSADGRTEYEFVIKNGIKFSNGSDLTIKDVLFNLYVYLDPAYTGSMTLYSVDIQGLNAYRMQSLSVGDGDLADVDAQFTGPAQTKINELVKWSSNKVETVNQEDLKVVQKQFQEDIEADWTSMVTSWSDAYKDSYRFKSAWEAFLFAEGIITVQTAFSTAVNSQQPVFEDLNNNGKKDDGELYYTTLDPNQPGVSGETGEVEAKGIIDMVEKHVSDNLEKYKSEHEGVSEEDAIEALQREICLKIVYTNYAESRTNLKSILLYWTTGANVLQKFIGTLRSQWYEDLKGDDNKLAVETIKGIQTYKTDTFNGKQLGSTHDVLKIVVNGVDPRAEYNFSFGVAPLYYYSGEYKGVNYVTEANGVNKFGVDMGNSEFFSDVLQDTEKNGLPMGAGAYKASSRTEGGTVDRTTFLNNNVVYFERNEYFETVGEGIENAKIKRVSYRVMGDDKVLDALKTGEIDYGEPNAKPSTKQQVDDESHLESLTYTTGGYGYIGINPKYIPQVQARRAIMKAFDTNLILTNYYGSSLAKIINRPISETSWAFPDDGYTEHPTVAYTTDNNEITNLLVEAGYSRDNSRGIWYNGDTDTWLELTFTLAGETTDHPAYTVFLDAAERLNKIGFKITVAPDIQALRKMNSGSLAVWAAAYTSALDPDMFQVFHKDSRATSVNNWNYSGILNDTNHVYDFEYDIIAGKGKLSDKIDEARRTLDRDTRKRLYKECLNYVMELAVEFPTYQRNDLCVYNIEVLDVATLYGATDGQTASYNLGPISKLWEVDYIK